MAFYPENAPVPEKLQTEAFLIRPLTPAHVELDYAALMSNKEMLRLWSGSSWPADDFTLAENLSDLEWHWSEHQERIAFTFTVLNITEDSCLGCVYIKPFTEILIDNPEWNTAVSTSATNASPHSALVRFWTINNLDKTLLPFLQQWFSTKWAFPEIYWHTPTNNSHQINAFQAVGLQTVGAIQLPNRGGQHILFK